MGKLEELPSSNHLIIKPDENLPPGSKIRLENVALPSPPSLWRDKIKNRTEKLGLHRPIHKRNLQVWSTVDNTIQQQIT